MKDFIVEIILDIIASLVVTFLYSAVLCLVVGWYLFAGPYLIWTNMYEGDLLPGIGFAVAYYLTWHVVIWWMRRSD